MDLAKEHIKQGIIDFKDFLTYLGESATPVIRKAWDRAQIQHALQDRSESNSGVFDNSLLGEHSTNGYKPVELPELNDIVKQLLGNDIKLRQFRKALGKFFHRGEIGLHPELFKRGNEEDLIQTLAHEIGHMVDWLPDRDMKRGNLIGSIHALHEFLKSTMITGTMSPLTDVELAKARREATKTILAIKGIRPVDYAKDKSIRDSLKDDIQNELYAIIARRGGIHNAQIAEELRQFSYKWRPFDETTATDRELAYRNNPRELFADALSAFFTSPGLLEKEAPVFFKEFLSNLSKRQEFSDLYSDIQALMSGDRKALVERRVAKQIAGYEKGEKLLNESVNKKEEKDKRNFWTKVSKIFGDKAAIGLKLLSKKDTGIGKNLNDYQRQRNIHEKIPFSLNEMWDVLQRMDISPIEYMESHGIPRSIVGAYLENKRVALSRKDIANPHLLREKDAKENLRLIWEGLTTEQQKIVTRVMNKWRNNLLNIMKQGYDAGLYSDEHLQQFIDESKAYSTFRFNDYVDSGYSSKVIKASGGTGDIQNPLYSTALMAIKVVHDARINMEKKNYLDLLRNEIRAGSVPPTELIDNLHVNLDKSLSVKEQIPQGYKAVLYKDKGKWEAYAVKKDVADMFDRYSDDAINKHLMNYDKYVNRPSKALFTKYNPGFVFYANVFKDLSRTNRLVSTVIRSLPENRGWMKSALLSMWLPLKNTGNYFKYSVKDSAKLSAGIKTPLAEEILKNDALLLNSMVGEYDPVMHTHHEDVARKAKLVHGEHNEGNWFSKFYFGIADTLEKASKFAAYKTLRDYGFDEEAAAYYTRNYAGTPNFTATGDVTSVANKLIPFFNMTAQALKADAELASNKHTRGAYWSQIVASQVPSTLIKLAALGYAGSVIKQMYDEIPEYVKSNYLVIPIGHDSNGKVMYWKAPMDEQKRLYHAILWKSEDALFNKAGYTGLKDITAMGEGALPSLPPILELGRGVYDYFTTGNIYDTYLDRKIFNDEDAAMNSLTYDKIYKLATWSLSKYGLSELSKILSYDPYRDETDEYLMRITPIVGRMFGRSSMGQVDYINKFYEPIKEESATQNHEERKLVMKVSYNYSGYSLENMNSAMNDVKKELYGDKSLTETERTNLRGLKEQMRNALINGTKSPVAMGVAAILRIQSTRERKELLDEMKEKMNDDGYADEIEAYLKKYDLLGGHSHSLRPPHPPRPPRHKR